MADPVVKWDLLLADLRKLVPSVHSFNMKAVSDARWVLARAWSFRLMVLAAILSGLEVAISVAIAWQIKPPVPAGVFAAMAGIVTVAAAIARFVAQDHDK